MIKIIDLFAGMGGIKLGFENAGFKSIFSNDFNKYCKITFDNNFKEKMYLGDIHKIKSEDLPQFDVLTGGFPCQSFSIAGNKMGFKDKNRGNLFFEIVRILRDKKPQAFLLENVKNLESHDNGRTLQIILDSLKDLGYYVKYQILNTEKHGNLPQNRERIFIIGFLDKKYYNNFFFPEKIPLTKTFQDCLENDVDKKYYNFNEILYNKLKKRVVDKQTAYQYRWCRIVEKNIMFFQH